MIHKTTPVGDASDEQLEDHVLAIVTDPGADYSPDCAWCVEADIRGLWRPYGPIGWR